ncbi:hypothetical protein HDU86_001914 [Geranomyces michiganensis]|nr:hypothetical protein HDU86_001914 [Geranomyces michiganensis]
MSRQPPVARRTISLPDINNAAPYPAMRGLAGQVTAGASRPPTDANNINNNPRVVVQAEEIHHHYHHHHHYYEHHAHHPQCWSHNPGAGIVDAPHTVVIDGHKHHHHHHHLASSELSPRSLSVLTPGGARAITSAGGEITVDPTTIAAEGLQQPFHVVEQENMPIAPGSPPTSFTPLASGAPTPGNATPVGAQSPPLNLCQQQQQQQKAKTLHSQNTFTKPDLRASDQKTTSNITKIPPPPPAPAPQTTKTSFSAVAAPTNAQIHESNRKRLTILREVFMADPEGHRQACRELKDWCNDRRAYVAEIAADLDLTLRAATEKGVAPPHDAGIALEVMHVVERQKRFMSALAAENCAVYTKVLTECVRQQRQQKGRAAGALSALTPANDNNDKTHHSAPRDTGGGNLSLLSRPRARTPPIQIIWTGASNPASASTTMTVAVEPVGRNKQSQVRRRATTPAATTAMALDDDGASSPSSMPHDFFSLTSAESSISSVKPATKASTTSSPTLLRGMVSSSSSFTGFLTSPSLLDWPPTWEMPTTQPFGKTTSENNDAESQQQNGAEQQQQLLLQDISSSQQSTATTIFDDDDEDDDRVGNNSNHAMEQSSSSVSAVDTYAMDFAALVRGAVGDEDTDGFGEREDAEDQDGHAGEDAIIHKARHGGDDDLMDVDMERLEHMECDWI